MVWQHGLSIKTEGLPWQRDGECCICDQSDEDATLWINQMHKRGRGWGICPRVGELSATENRDAGATLPEGLSQLGRTSR